MGNGTLAAQTGLAQQLAKRAVDTSKSLALSQLASLGARDDDDIMAAAQLGFYSVKGLAQQTLDVVALNRAAHLARHRQPETRAVDRLVGERVEH